MRPNARQSAARVSKAEGDRIAEAVLRLCQAIADAAPRAETSHVRTEAEHARLARRQGLV